MEKQVEEGLNSKNGHTIGHRYVPNDNAEAASSVIATVVLCVGLIVTVYCLITLTTTKVVDPTYEYSVHYNTVFQPSGLLISIGVLLATLSTWALLRVVENISLTLKAMCFKMK